MTRGAFTAGCRRKVNPCEPMYLHIDPDSGTFVEVVTERPPKFQERAKAGTTGTFDALESTSGGSNSSSRERDRETSSGEGSGGDGSGDGKDSRERSSSGERDGSSSPSVGWSDPVQGSADLIDEVPAVVKGPRTTVTLHGISNNYTRQMLLTLLDQSGFDGCYDLVYLPVDVRTRLCLGHALVNLTTVDVANRFIAHFSDASDLAVSWNSARQGLMPCLEWYRNSPVMHARVPDVFKPIMLVNGKRVPFPKPTLEIDAPVALGLI